MLQYQWQECAVEQKTMRHRKIADRQVFDEMTERDVVSWNSIVNGYVKVVVGQQFFDEMPQRNLVGWNVMVTGNPTDGLNLCADLVSSSLEDTEIDHVKNMKQGEGDHVLPDEITFVGVLCARAREGLNIPIESNLPLTSSLRSELLGLARFSGDVMLGEQIANKLIEQDSEKFWCHLLLVNIYAAASRWDEVAQTKERMKKRGKQHQDVEVMVFPISSADDVLFAERCK
uniref:Pentatricopeptide repeat-containing protein n=1 Tax=Solanum tuberosum TaxID=4113 RepID=M0ZXG2_SOLTU